ncbi:CD40 ligand [Bufo gargarizans]|uniref:CD40 ligand n=1 Tax=Bufo gargarizans TaxID=30331 RepID=UPI001CF29121|nr:CD40 ligand [Bufo gargarizans]
MPYSLSSCLTKTSFICCTMINSYNQSPPADPSRGLKSPSSIMKISVWIFTLSVLAQVVGICIFGVYFHTKIDKIEDEMNLSEEYLFIRRIQKCRKEGNVDSSLLSCKEVLNRFRSLIPEIIPTGPSGEKHEKLTDRNPMPYVGEKDVTVKKDAAVAIHLVGDRPNSTKEALRWKEKGYLTTKSEISYTNGKLRVETPGVYYVYSQVSFSASSAQFQKAPFVQYIYMKRMHETERLLVKGANTLAQPAISALHSSKVGAVFTLKRNDFIFVNVTDPSLIDYSPELTYFGMFKLGETS